MEGRRPFMTHQGFSETSSIPEPPPPPRPQSRRVPMIVRIYETIVGIFVVASMAALLVMVLIVAQQEGLFQEYVTHLEPCQVMSAASSPAPSVHPGSGYGGQDPSTPTIPRTLWVTFQGVEKRQQRARSAACPGPSSVSWDCWATRAWMFRLPRKAAISRGCDFGGAPTSPTRGWSPP